MQAVNNLQVRSTEAIYAPDILNKPKRQLRELLVEEGFENLVSYIEWLKLDKETNALVLPSMNHFFYNTEELKEVSTLVNLKELNHIKEINNFFHTIYNNLQPKTYFIGYFTDNRKNNGYRASNLASFNKNSKNSEAIEYGIISKYRILNMIYQVIDLKTYNYLTKNDVASILSKSGFKVVDMTELNGHTYFLGQKQQAGSN